MDYWGGGQWVCWPPPSKIIGGPGPPLPTPMKTDPLIRRVSSHILKNVTKHMDISFFRTYRPFMFQGRVKREVYAKLDGCLHLSNEGTNKLRNYFIRSIAAM